MAEQTGFEPKHALYMHRFWPTKKRERNCVGSKRWVRGQKFNSVQTFSCRGHRPVLLTRHWWITHQQRLSDVPQAPVCFNACDFGPCEPEIVLRSSPSPCRSPWLLRTKSRARAVAAYRTVGLGP